MVRSRERERIIGSRTARKPRRHTLHRFLRPLRLTREDSCVSGASSGGGLSVGPALHRVRSEGTAHFLDLSDLILTLTAKPGTIVYLRDARRECVTSATSLRRLAHGFVPRTITDQKRWHRHRRGRPGVVPPRTPCGVNRKATPERKGNPTSS
jgi:hypothetical protein